MRGMSHSSVTQNVNIFQASAFLRLPGCLSFSILQGKETCTSFVFWRTLFLTIEDGVVNMQQAPTTRSIKLLATQRMTNDIFQHFLPQQKRLPDAQAALLFCCMLEITPCKRSLKNVTWDLYDFPGVWRRRPKVAEDLQRTVNALWYCLGRLKSALQIMLWLRRITKSFSPRTF